MATPAETAMKRVHWSDAWALAPISAAGIARTSAWAPVATPVSRLQSWAETCCARASHRPFQTA